MTTLPGGLRSVDSDSIANEFQCKLGENEGSQENRQEPLSSTPENDNRVLGCVEDFSAARLSAIADLQSVTSKVDRYLDGVVHFDRSDPLIVYYDIV
jgi:hypothetical protein